MKRITPLFIGLLSFSCAAQVNSFFHEDRSVSPQVLNEEGLHSASLHDLGESLYEPDPYWALTDLQELILSNHFHLQTPELDHLLTHTEKQTLAKPEIARLIALSIQEKSALDLLEEESTLRNSLKNTELSPQDRITMHFYQGYEFFKKKDFAKAQKSFNKVIKARKGHYAYASFYMACAKIIQGEYDNAHEYLMKVNKEPALTPYLPYYLALTHYGRRNYHDVTRYYADRLKESGIYEKESLRRLVGWSFYHQEQWSQSAQSMHPLYVSGKLTEQEEMILSMALKNAGHYAQAIDVLTPLTNHPDAAFKDRATYMLASTHAEAGKYPEAIRGFTALIENGQSKWEQDIRWNLAILHKKSGNYQKSAQYANSLLKTRRYAQAEVLLKKLYKDHLNEGEKEIIVSNALNDGSSLEFLNKDLYAQAVRHVSSQQFDKAILLFDQLEKQGINRDQKNEADLWRGIIAYHQGKYKKSGVLLDNALAQSTGGNSKLKLDAQYLLSYIRFREKNHSAALGHFSTVYGQINDPKLHLSPGFVQNMKEDVLLRIGDIYFVTGRYKDSKNAYNDAKALNGNHKDHALFQQAILADLEDKPYDQLLLLEELIEGYPKSKYQVKARFATANTYFSLGKFTDATSIYQSLLRNATDEKIAESSLIQLGLISVNAGDFSQAESYYRSILERSNDPANRRIAENGLKEIYADYTHDTDQYLELASQVVKEKKDQPKDVLLFDLASKNLASGKSEQAKSQYEKLISEYEQSAKRESSHLALIKIYMDEGEFQKSAEHLIVLMDDFEHSIKPDQINPVLNSLFQFAVKGRQWHTITHLLNHDGINDVISESPRLLYYAAVSEFNDDRLDEAANRIIDHYSVLLDDPAWLAKSIILLADIHFLQGDTSSATAAIKALLETDENIPDSLLKQAKKRLQTFEL